MDTVSSPAQTSVPPRPSGRLSRGETRRALLLADLESLFLAEGFSDLTVDEMCRRARCSKTTLYSIASTREQIVQAVVRHFFARSTEEIEGRLKGITSPATRIEVYLEGVGSAMRRNSLVFYRDMIRYQPTARIYRVNSQAAAKTVRQLIEEGVQDGTFRAANAALAGLTVSALIDGVQSGEVLEATGLQAGDAFSELGRLLLHGLTS